MLLIVFAADGADLVKFNYNMLLLNMLKLFIKSWLGLYCRLTVSSPFCQSFSTQISFRCRHFIYVFTVLGNKSV